MRFSLVSGAVVAPTTHSGALTQLSTDEAELATGAEVAPLTNLKIQLLDRGAPVAGDLYAKVLADDEGGTRLAFTSVPPTVREFLEQRLTRDV